MVSEQIKKINWRLGYSYLPVIKKRIHFILGMSYFLILTTGFILLSVFPFEITQEVFIVNNQTNYLISEITEMIVGLTVIIMLSHLWLMVGYNYGVAITEKSFKKIQSRKES